MLAFTQNILSWCYDDGRTLAGERARARIHTPPCTALDTHADCLSGALVDAVAKRDSCMSSMLTPQNVAQANTIDVSHASMSLMLQSIVGR